jgi:DNA-directed RNA polymerase sigma subunit (sigma70/sigma32)
MATHKGKKNSTNTPRVALKPVVSKTDIAWADRNPTLRRRYIEITALLATEKVQHNNSLSRKLARELDAIGREFFIINERLIHSQARLFQRGVDADQDNVSAATLGLWEAFKKYDPDRGVAFSTFSRQFMAGAVQRTVRRNEFSHISQADFNLRKQVILAQGQMAVRLSRMPTVEETAAFTGLSVDKVLHIFEGAPASLEQPIFTGNHNTDPTTMGSMLADKLDINGMEIPFEHYLSDLNDLEFWIISQRCGLYGVYTPSLLEVASFTGIGREIARRVETKAKIRIIESALMEKTLERPSDIEIAKLLGETTAHVTNYRSSSFEDLRGRLTRYSDSVVGQKLNSNTQNDILKLIGEEFMFLSRSMIADIATRGSKGITATDIKTKIHIGEASAAQALWTLFQNWDIRLTSFPAYVRANIAKTFIYAGDRNDLESANATNELWDIIHSTVVV